MAGLLCSICFTMPLGIGLYELRIGRCRIFHFSFSIQKRLSHTYGMGISVLFAISPMCGVCVTRESRPEGTLYIVRHILDFCSTLRYRKSTGLSSSSGRRYTLASYTPHCECGVKAPTSRWDSAFGTFLSIDSFVQ